VNAAPQAAGAGFLASPTADRDGAGDRFPQLTPDDLTLPLPALPESVRPEPVPSGGEPSQAGSVPPGPVSPDSSQLSHRRDRAPAAGRAQAGRGSHGRPRRMRGLLVTPWFAAGAGVVIAATLALNSPHTVLTYKPNTSRCASCVPPRSLATARPGVILRTPQPAARPRAERRATAVARVPQVPVGPAIGYRVIWTRNGAFAAIVTVPRAEAGHGWRLRFEIPGRRILRVWGARWAPAPGGYGGEVSSFVTGPQPGSSAAASPPAAARPSASPSPSASLGQPASPSPSVPPGTGHPGGPGQPDHWRPEQLTFLVSAQGSPRTPDECVLNGSACHFG
jgi:hypothetical protein